MSDYISKKEAMRRFMYESRKSNRNCIHINTIKRLMDDIDTLDEKEIIRKAFERVVERLEELKVNAFDDESVIMSDAIEIVKEECGINE